MSDSRSEETSSTERVIEKREASQTPSPILSGYILPGLPQILLAPEKNMGWGKLRRAYEEVRVEIAQAEADLLVIYSTYWPSILGHQIQALPEPEFVHVDDEFHDLGSIAYKFRIDYQFAESYRQCCEKRGLKARTVAYKDFPIDTGSVVALKLLNPENQIPAVIVSSNIYADRAETLILGQACADALSQSNKRAVALTITSMSNRLHSKWIAPEEDHISSLKDEEWNLKFIDFLKEGRLEDASQLSRQFHKEARVNKVNNFKPIWWLSALMGQSNNYEGKLFEYQPVWGTGAALIGLTPSLRFEKGLEFDEETPQFYGGDREVLGSSPESSLNQNEVDFPHKAQDQQNFSAFEDEEPFQTQVGVPS